MKKIFAIVLAPIFLFTTATHAAEPGDANMVFELFNQTFKDVQDLKWFTLNNEYIAYFSKNNIKTKVIYDDKGRLVSSRRQLTEDFLPVSILCKIKDKYKGKVIKNITEVTEQNEVTYALNIEDEDKVFVVEALPNRKIRQVLNFKKQSVAFQF